MAELSLGWKLWADISQFVSSMKKAKGESDSTTKGVAGGFREMSKATSLAGREFKDAAAKFGLASKEAQAALRNFKAAKTEQDKITGAMKTSSASSGGLGSGIGGIVAGYASLTAVVGLATSAISYSIRAAAEEEQQVKKLSFALGDNAGAIDRTMRLRTQLTATSMFTEDQISGAISMALELGRTESQMRKMVETAMGLSRVTGQDLQTVMQQLNGTYEGQVGRLGKLSSEIKGLTDSQLKNGEAVDILNAKYAKFGSEGLNTTAGQLKLMKDQIENFSENIGNFFTKAAFGFITYMKATSGALVGGGTHEGKVVIQTRAKEQALINEIQAQKDKNAANLEALKIQKAGSAEWVAAERLKVNAIKDVVKELKVQAQYVQSAQDKANVSAFRVGTGTGSVINKTPGITATPTGGGQTGLVGSGSQQVLGYQPRDVVEEAKSTVSQVSAIISQGLSPVFTNVFNNIGNLLVKFKEGFKGGLTEIITAVGELAMSVLSAIGAMVSESYDNKMAKLDAWYEKEKAYITASVTSEAQKKSQLAKLDKEADKKKRELQYKQAKDNKTVAIMQAAIAGALGIVNSLSQGGIMGIIMAVIVGALAAVQIAAIASTPLPALAQGGLAMAPTMAIVGDNPNAGVDPEVIAPLSKLRSIMGGEGGGQLSAVVRGEDLLFLLERTGKKVNRWA